MPISAPLLTCQSLQPVHPCSPAPHPGPLSSALGSPSPLLPAARLLQGPALVGRHVPRPEVSTSRDTAVRRPAWPGVMGSLGPGPVSGSRLRQQTQAADSGAARVRGEGWCVEGSAVGSGPVHQQGRVQGRCSGACRMPHAAVEHAACRMLQWSMPSSAHALPGQVGHGQPAPARAVRHHGPRAPAPTGAPPPLPRLHVCVCAHQSAPLVKATSPV
jgi:hypothetical protein